MNLGDNEIIPITKCSHNRRVHFPPEDKGVVTVVHNPVVTPFVNNEFLNCNPKVLLEKYRNTCKTMGLKPLPFIEKQIEVCLKNYFTKIFLFLSHSTLV